MKKFEELKKEQYEECKAILRFVKSQLEKAGTVSAEEKEELTKMVKQYELYTQNIGQVTRQYISRNVKKLMNALQETYMHPSYYSNFNWFIRTHAGYDFNDTFIQGPYFPLQLPMINLGLSLEDMKIFMGKDPKIPNVYDEFAELINKQMGSEIPTRAELRQAKILYDIEPTEENLEAYNRLRVRDGDVDETEPYTIYNGMTGRGM